MVCTRPVRACCCACLLYTSLGVKEEMLEGIAEGTFIMDGGYKVLTKDEIMTILKQSMK